MQISPLVGPSASASLAEALRRVGELLPYVKAVVGPVTCVVARSAQINDGMWLACEDLISDPDWLTQVVLQTGQAIHTDDQVVAASIFVQGYAYRLFMLSIATLALCGVVAGTDPADLAVGLSRGRVAKVAYAEPKLFRFLVGNDLSSAFRTQDTSDLALRIVIDEVIEGHLRALIHSTRKCVRMGERLLWGNVAASAATAFRTMEGSLGRWIVPMGQRFFELGPSELKGLGSYLEIEKNGKRGWFWERTNCCLFEKIEGHVRCSDCSLMSKTERRAKYSMSLED